MKHLINRLTGVGSKVVAHIKMGCDTCDLVSDGNDKKLLMNGYETISCGGGQPSDTANILSDILSRAFSSGKAKLIVLMDSGSDDVVEDVVEKIKKAIGADKVSVKGLRNVKIVRPAEEKIQGGINTDALSKNVRILSSRMASAAEAIASVRDAAHVLTGRRLVQSMWGADKLQAVIDDVKSKLENQRNLSYNVVSSADVASKSAMRLSSKLSANNSDDRILVTKLLIPNITNSYHSVKMAAADTVSTVVPLVYLDDTCKNVTTYPASWFFDEDMLESISQNYDLILRFLVQVPVIEAKVIDPLLSVGASLTEEK